ncbi:MAG: ABC transporter substrate-binding protein, partial [Caulobacterales bacterium]|nr:ABC transporter substrate-binding protein [Caulobacterales bacterium]
MARLAALAAVLLAAASGTGAASAPPAPERPARVVSLDFCADQYVLKLVERQRVLALSPDATREFSYMRAEAAGVRSVRPRAEDVILLEPDLVVRSYGGGPNAAAFFERAGVP